MKKGLIIGIVIAIIIAIAVFLLMNFSSLSMGEFKQFYPLMDEIEGFDKNKCYVSDFGSTQRFLCNNINHDIKFWIEYSEGKSCFDGMSPTLEGAYYELLRNFQGIDIYSLENEQGKLHVRKFCDNEDKFSFTIDADYFIEPEFTNEVIEKLVLNS